MAITTKKALVTAPSDFCKEEKPGAQPGFLI